MHHTNEMAGVMTVEDVMGVAYFEMPRAFFEHPSYMPMKCESKLAYMLLHDLLPLSAANNWVNERDELFVKIPSEKLMAILNVKGSQKAAQIMRELVDYELIVSKRVGSGQCNEIYLYPPLPATAK